MLNQDDEVLIFITTKKSSTKCPYCSSNKIEIKEYRDRKINHTLFLAKNTTFYHHQRRFKCLSCLKTFSESSPFAPRRARESYETIRLILKYAASYTRTWKDIGEMAHVSDTTAINIFDKYMNPPRRKLSKVLSMDECYNDGNFHHAYSCILMDFLNQKIIDIIDGREKNILIKYFQTFSKEELNIVKYVVMDMWEPYLDVATLLFPNALVAIDSFHVIQNMTKALNDIRIKVMSRYESGTKEYYILKHWHKVIFNTQKVDEEKMKIKGYNYKWLNRYDIQQIILSLDDDLKYAQRYYMLYRYHNMNSSKEEFKEKIKIFINDKDIVKIKEFVPIVEMLSNWEPYIINSFENVDGKRLSNGPIESFNANFGKLIKTSNSLYTHKRFRNRLMYTYNEINHLSRTSEPLEKPKRGKRGPYKKPSKS